MINLNITAEALDQLTWEQWEVFEPNNKSVNYHEAREIMSLFVVGIEKTEAMEMLGKLKTSEMKSVFQQFVDKVAELGNVNPTTGGG
jgi:hypothetical protein